MNPDSLTELGWLPEGLADLYQQKLVAGELEGALYLLAKPYRMSLLDLWYRTGFVDQARLRVLLVQSWQGTEFPYQIRRLALDLFRAAGFLTDAADLWDRLDDPVEIWRGTQHLRPRGLSWTISRERAAWFAGRFARTQAFSYLLAAESISAMYLRCLRGELRTRLSWTPKGLEVTRSLSLELMIQKFSLLRRTADESRQQGCEVTRYLIST